jgi:hypothetical protein
MTPHIGLFALADVPLVHQWVVVRVLIVVVVVVVVLLLFLIVLLFVFRIPMKQN